MAWRKRGKSVKFELLNINWAFVIIGAFMLRIPRLRQVLSVVRHTMTDPITIAELIELVKNQEPEREDVIFALINTIGGHWESKAYYKFVSTKNANKKGAEWQFDENIILEHETLGTIVLDYLKDKRIGGIEFVNFIL